MPFPQKSLSCAIWGLDNLALLCSYDAIQILLILSLFQTLRTETKLKGFVWIHWSITSQYLTPKLQQDADFWQVSVFITLFANILINHIISKNICDATIQFTETFLTINGREGTSPSSAGLISFSSNSIL